MEKCQTVKPSNHQTTMERDMFIELEDAKMIPEGDIETMTFVSRLPAKEWLSTVDFALAAGLSDQQVRRLITTGRLVARFKGTGNDGRSEYQIARARAIQYFKDTLSVF